VDGRERQWFVEHGIHKQTKSLAIDLFDQDCLQPSANESQLSIDKDSEIRTLHRLEISSTWW
jgi:hypothetical protein